MLNMKTGPKGLKLIKFFEGLRLSAYRDPVGIWTIGYGHTTAAGLPVVQRGMRITKDQAENLLKKDLIIYEDAVKRNVTVPLNQNQFDALVSFTYNLGEGNLRKSTLLKKLNAGDYKGAAGQFGRWNKAGGKVLAGLTKRRKHERWLFEDKEFDIPEAEDQGGGDDFRNLFGRFLDALIEFLTNWRDKNV